MAQIMAGTLLMTGTATDPSVIFADDAGTEQNGTSDGESLYNGEALTAAGQVSSPDGNIVTKFWRDKNGGLYYSVMADGICVIHASKLGMVTGDADFTAGSEYTMDTPKQVTDDYMLYHGKHKGNISDTCTEVTMKLVKSGKTLVITMRVYDDGIAYRYSGEAGTKIVSEASEYVFPDDFTLWSYSQPNVTYEGSYAKIPETSVTASNATYTQPSIVKTGDHYVLMTEGAKFDNANTFYASLLKTVSGSKHLTWTFGNKQSVNLVMTEAFETPWRIAVIGDNLNTVVNSDIVTSVNEDAKDRDWSFVKPGKLAWSWWSSTGDNPIAFDPQYEYIDFAAANGWEYVCLDYGWVLWENYQEKVKELVDYAAEKGVGIWLWYGVNNVGHTGSGAYPKYSLLNQETIEKEFSWAQSIGIKGVKVDYYESDTAQTMNQMYLCAELAAEHQLMVLFHGCTNPAGESRTFPNVLSYEAVYGAEYYKWRQEPSAANIITYLFTRNAVESADFTPTAMPVAGIGATYGFMLGTAIYIESGLVHFAENVNVYEGYEGLSLMNDMPVSWDETVVAEGELMSYGSVARRNGEDWYLASLTTAARTTDISLDFLGDGMYTAYIYKTAADRSGLEIETKTVTNKDRLAIPLTAQDGFAAKITKQSFDPETEYEKNYDYYEAEQAVLSGSAAKSNNPFNAQYSSGKQLVGNIGNGEENNVTFSVDADEAGIHEVTVYYVSGNDRRFLVSVNGDSEHRLRTGKLNSGDWVTVEKEVLYLDLQKGSNTITFYNDKAYAPDIDRISVSKSLSDHETTASDEEEDVTDNQPGAEYDYNIYEAENAVLAGGATKESFFAGWIGGNGTVTFDKVTVDNDGEYYLKVSYMTGEDRDFYLSVNGGENMVISCPASGDYNSNPAVIYQKITLKAGENTLVFSRPGGFAPNLDSIGISKTVISDGTEQAQQAVESEENLQGEDKTADQEQKEPGVTEQNAAATKTIKEPVAKIGDHTGAVALGFSMVAAVAAAWAAARRKLSGGK